MSDRRELLVEPHDPAAGPPGSPGQQTGEAEAPGVRPAPASGPPEPASGPPEPASGPPGSGRRPAGRSTRRGTARALADALARFHTPARRGIWTLPAFAVLLGATASRHHPVALPESGPTGWILMIAAALAGLAALGSLTVLLAGTRSGWLALAGLVAGVPGTGLVLATAGELAVREPGAVLRGHLAAATAGGHPLGMPRTVLLLAGVGLLVTGWLLAGLAVLAVGRYNRVDGGLVAASAPLIFVGGFGLRMLPVLGAMLLLAAGIGVAWAAYRLDVPDAVVPGAVPDAVVPGAVPDAVVPGAVPGAVVAGGDGLAAPAGTVSRRRAGSPPAGAGRIWPVVNEVRRRPATAVAAHHGGTGGDGARGSDAVGPGAVAGRDGPAIPGDPVPGGSTPDAPARDAPAPEEPARDDPPGVGTGAGAPE